MIAVMGVLSVLVITLGVLVAVLVFGKDEKKSEEKVEEPIELVMDEKIQDDEKGKKESDDKTSDEKTSEAIKENEVGEDDLYISNGTKKGVTFVMDRFEIHVPPEYYCFYEEGLGCIVQLEDVFQLRFKIEEKSYKELVENKESLTELAIKGGYEVTKEPTETMVNGKEYVYFSTLLEEEKVFVIHTQSPDADRTIGAQLVLFDKEKSDEEVVNIFAGIVAKAKVTDAKDSTADEILMQNYETTIGDVKEESTLTFGNDAVTFKVQEGFYSIMRDKTDYYAVEYFEEEDYDVFVQCRLWGKDTYDSAEMYIQSMINWESDSDTTIKVKNEEVGDAICYYFMTVNAEGDIRRLYATYNNSDTSLYCIEVECMNPNMEFGFENIRDFMYVVK